MFPDPEGKDREKGSQQTGWVLVFPSLCLLLFVLSLNFNPLDWTVDSLLLFETPSETPHSSLSPFYVSLVSQHLLSGP